MITRAREIEMKLIMPVVSAAVVVGVVAVLVVVGALPTIAAFLAAQIDSLVPATMRTLVTVSLGVTATIAILVLLPIFFIWFERKVAAHIQDRLGPMRVGWHGVVQSFADGLKLLFKEDIIPEKVDRTLFKLAPYLVVAGTFAAFAVIPWGRDLVVADLNIGILYIVAITSFNTIGILMAGWASANKYALYGGMRSVIITDVFQFVILLGGAIATIVIITVKLGGFGWWPTQWAPNWDTQPVFSADPTVRATALGAIIAVIIWWVCTAGSDQVVIQRYLATPNAKTARRSFLTNMFADLTVTAVLACVGFALLGFFRANPQYLPSDATVSENADKLFPHFITNFLSPGFAGLVVAGMFAAAMSSLDSGINSIVTVFTTDFLPRLRRKSITDKQKLKLAKYLVLAIGVGVVLISSMMGKVPGNIIEVTNKTNGLFVGPLFVLFLLALFVPFSNAFGAFFGTLYGFIAAAVWGYWDLIANDESWRLTFQWITVVSLVAGVGSGVLLSWLWSRRKSYLAATGCYMVAVVPLLAVIGYVVFLSVTSRL